MLKAGFLLMAVAAALFFSGTPGAGGFCIAALAAGIACLGAGQLGLWRRILTHKP